MNNYFLPFQESQREVLADPPAELRGADRDTLGIGKRGEDVVINGLGDEGFFSLALHETSEVLMLDLLVCVARGEVGSAAFRNGWRAGRN